MGNQLDVAVWVWVTVAAGVALAVFLLFLAARGKRTEKLEERRREARELRGEAEDRFAEAARREVAARQDERRAELERVAAEDALQRADAVDPEVPDVPHADESASDAPRPSALRGESSEK